MSSAAMAYRFLISASALLVSGCVQEYWVKPGNGQQQFDADWFACEQIAAGAYPTNMQVIQTRSGYTTQSGADCVQTGHGSFSCVGYGGTYVPPQGVTLDMNTSNRRNATERCMSGKGWNKSSKSMFDTGKTSSMTSDDWSLKDEKFVVELGGYCNENDDCIKGLKCKHNMTRKVNLCSF